MYKNNKYNPNEINVNLDFNTLIYRLNTDNFLDVVKILNIKYGVNYKSISEIMNIQLSEISRSIKLGSTDYRISDKKLIDGIQRLKSFYNI